MPSLVVALPAILLVALLAELVIGLFVLERGQGRTAVRFLAAFMLIHAITFGVFATWHLVNELTSTHLTDSSILFTLIVWNLLPPLLLAFALSYPTLHPWAKDRPWVLGLPFLPLAGFAVLVAIDPLAAATADAGASGVPLTLFGFLGGLPLAALGAAGIFWWRRTQAKTQLERDRLAYMAKVIAGPVALVGAIGILVIAFVELDGPFDPVFLSVVSGLALVPAFGLGYGVLRYQILDLDLKLKKGIKGSTLAGVFIAVFFIVSEGAQVLLAGFAGSELLGVLAAGALVFVLSPLQRLAQRVSDTAMPGVEDTLAHRQERKTEVYRATLEEVLADGQMTAKDRRVLLSLQESLGLDGNDASHLEREVLAEIGDLEPEGPQNA